MRSRRKMRNKPPGAKMAPHDPSPGGKNVGRKTAEINGGKIKKMEKLTGIEKKDEKGART